MTSLAKARMQAVAREAAFRAASGKEAIGTDAIADAVTDALWPHISRGFARPPGKGQTQDHVKAGNPPEVLA